MVVGSIGIRVGLIGLGGSSPSVSAILRRQEMKQEFVGHWCVSRHKHIEPRWRSYCTVHCSHCLGETYGSINRIFPDRDAYDKMLERNKRRENDFLDDGWRN